MESLFLLVVELVEVLREQHPSRSLDKVALLQVGFLPPNASAHLVNGLMHEFDDMELVEYVSRTPYRRRRI